MDYILPGLAFLLLTMMVLLGIGKLSLMWADRKSRKDS